MLDINLIKNNPDYVKEALAKKGWEVDFTELLEKVEKRLELARFIAEYLIERVNDKNQVEFSLVKLLNEYKLFENCACIHIIALLIG